MTDDELKKADDYVHNLYLDVQNIRSDSLLLKLPDELVERLDQSMKIIECKIREIEHCESEKQLKKLIRLKNILNMEK